MAISFVGSGAVGFSTTGATFNFSSLVDAGGAAPTLQQGDLVVVSIAYRTTTGAGQDATPTGYTAAYSNIFQDATGNDVSLKTTYKFMGASPDTSVVLPAATSRAAAVIHVLRGVSISNPLDVTPTTTGTANAATNPNAPAITPVTAGAWIYVVGGTATSTPSTNITNSGDLSTTTNHFKGALTTNTVGAVAAGLKEDWVSGSFDPAAFTGGGANSTGATAAASVAFRPIAAYVLTASAGSYALSGGSAILETARKLLATAGAYALSGESAALKAGRKLLASAGSYALNGESAILKAARKLLASAGSYAETGADATLITARKLLASAGSYALLGATAILAVGRLLSGSAGSYALNGEPAGLIVARTLSASPGSYTVTGASASIVAARLLVAGAGSYALNGETAAIPRGYTLTGSPGSYALSGAPAALIVQRILSADPGVYTLTGEQAALAAHRLLLAGAGAYALTGEAAGLLRSYVLTGTAGVYVLDGADATFSVVVPYVISADRHGEVGAFERSGIVAIMDRGGVVEAIERSFEVLVIDRAATAPGGGRG